MACVLTFTQTLNSPLNIPYFNEKVWEAKGKIYRQLGINYFRKLLVFTTWEKLNKKTKPVEKSEQAISYLYYRSKQDELGHLIIFVIVSGFTIFVTIKFGIIKALSLFFLNILLNLYPIFLQRYNRPRLERIMRKFRYI